MHLGVKVDMKFHSVIQKQTIEILWKLKTASTMEKSGDNERERERESDRPQGTNDRTDERLDEQL